ncbi:MAG: SH3 domain-containing protein, partial [Clostridia bacterium]|nr:SH3 domain-containing protein [Clostridia bacterium]
MLKKKPFIAIVVLVVLAQAALLLPMGSPFVSAAGTGTVDTFVNLRKTASTSADIITILSPDKAFTILGTEGRWSKIEYSGKTGYVLSSFVKSGSSTSSASSASNSGYPKTAYIKASTANMRKGPGVDKAIADTLEQGAAVTLTGKQGEWYSCRRGDISGFIREDLITFNKDSAGSSSSADTTAGGSTGGTLKRGSE